MQSTESIPHLVIKELWRYARVNNLNRGKEFLIGGKLLTLFPDITKLHMYKVAHELKVRGHI